MSEELKHLTASQVTDAKTTAEPLQRSATGYGPKLPIGYMLKIGTRWHRVYVVNYGNSGSTYVVLKGQDHYLSSGVESILETVRDGGTHAEALQKLQEWPQWMQELEGFKPEAPAPSDPSQYDYRASELSKVDASGEYPAKLQIDSDSGATKWLNITATEFEQIKAVLLDYRTK
jgi:hypothetical protein